MQKRRFFFNLIILTGCILSVLAGSITAQSANDLADLYENQQFVKLKEYYQGNRIHDSDWKDFVRALVEDDADTAIMMFARVYRSSRDKVLKKYVTERISDYYYARGYYKTSERILRDKRFLDEIVSTQRDPEGSDNDSYGVQVGAFSSYENALALKNKMLKKKRNVTIVDKKSDGESLFLVVVGNYSDREVAEKELQSLRSSNVDGFIIQY